MHALYEPHRNQQGEPNERIALSDLGKSQLLAHERRLASSGGAHFHAALSPDDAELVESRPKRAVA
eukprot:564551-Pleurochrysis_carterae.AAC.1